MVKRCIRIHEERGERGNLRSVSIVKKIKKRAWHEEWRGEHSKQCSQKVIFPAKRVCAFVVNNAIFCASVRRGDAIMASSEGPWVKDGA